MLADKAMIAKLIPHTGSMCLLDGVLERDTQRIRCVSSSHRDTDNPLRSGDELSALCGIEYAAQVMAVHGAWDTQLDSKPRAGYLAAVRDVTCHTMRLDNLNDDLVIEAERIMGDAARVIYQFSIHAGTAKIMSGRATVVLDVDKVVA
ncbi:MAG: hydroxymyristoyl-ACP dehydratase [Gallionella sp.]|jgi:predicted hotdog family 3-hydroxylacyl-ACP dehydratase|nr:hydroxymyristoyl-ACP dehydratase [Gallionella sp.]